MNKKVVIASIIGLAFLLNQVITRIIYTGYDVDNHVQSEMLDTISYIGITGFVFTSIFFIFLIAFFSKYKIILFFSLMAMVSSLGNMMVLVLSSNYEVNRTVISIYADISLIMALSNVGIIMFIRVLDIYKMEILNELAAIAFFILIFCSSASFLVVLTKLAHFDSEWPVIGAVSYRVTWWYLILSVGVTYLQIRLVFTLFDKGVFDIEHQHDSDESVKHQENISEFLEDVSQKNKSI